jgi:hypothetical protein
MNGWKRRPDWMRREKMGDGCDWGGAEKDDDDSIR